MIVPAGPTLYVGGQNGTDNTGALLDGLEAQTEQAMRNVLAVLAEAGTGPEYVAKLTIYLAAGVDPGRPTPQPVRYGVTAAPPSLSLLSHQRDRALSSRSRQ
jgi:hypothetical protein